MLSAKKSHLPNYQVTNHKHYRKHAVRYDKKAPPVLLRKPARSRHEFCVYLSFPKLTADIEHSQPGAGNVQDITFWLELLKNGDEEASQPLWERYYGKLVVLARKRLANVPLREVDEEDFAQSAFKSFCLGARDGRFPRLNDRHDLWKVLFTITARKVSAHHRRRNAAKRADPERLEHDQIVSAEPTPEDVALIGEAVAELLKKLPDDTYREIAQMKMEGYQNKEIARAIGCVPRTVERKLMVIREVWQQP